MHGTAMSVRNRSKLEGSSGPQPPLPDPDRRPVVVLSANSCWNLLNFRGALLKALQEAGYRLFAFAPLDEHAGELARRGVEVQPVPFVRAAMNPLSNVVLLARYVRMLRALRPAAYCGFTIKPNVYGAIAARITGVPAVNNVTGLGTVFLSRPLFWSAARRLYAFAFRRSHTVFFHNAEDLGLFVDNGIVRADQGRVIPGSGVDLDHFKPLGDSTEKASPPCFLFIGRLIEQKGIREFIEAARFVRASLPEARFQLLGNPDPGNRSSISDAELKSGLREGLVEHLGEHADVRPFIRAASAVVLPSYREGMSRALLEGAAMGKPLIAADVPGCRELIEEGVTGALVRVRDPCSLADAMLRLAEMPVGRLRQMGLAARAKVEREFDEQIVVKAYLDALDQVVRR